MRHAILLSILLAPLACCAPIAPRPCEPAPPATPLVPALTSRKVVPAGPARNDRPKELGRVTIAAVGDVLPHVAVKMSADAANVRDEKGASLNHEGWDALFADVAPELAKADFAVANLETPVSPSGDKGDVEYHFNAPAALLTSLKASGFKLVSFANNHTYDQGRKGFVETLDQLDKAGLPFYGAGRTRAQAQKGLVLEKAGIKIAFLAATEFFNKDELDLGKDDQPHANRAEDAAALLEAVKAARGSADFVIASVHWGAEYLPQPREAELQFAHELFEAGVDVILGSHPHVLQPLEIYEASDGRSCLVAYSLGNFISNQSYHYKFGIMADRVGDTRDGTLLQFAIARRDWGPGGIHAELADVSYAPLWTENDHVVKAGKDTLAIRTVSVARSLKDARDALDAFLAKVPPKPNKADQTEIVRLKKQVALYERRREIIEARLGPEFAAEHER